MNKIIFLFFSVNLLAGFCLGWNELRHFPSSQHKQPLKEQFLSSIYERENCGVACKQMLIEFDSDPSLLECVAGRLSHFLLNADDVEAERNLRSAN